MLRARGRQIELRYHVLHGDVACGVPPRFIDAFVHIEMEEYIVQRHMEKSPRRRGGFGRVALRERGRVEADVRPVGCKRRAGDWQRLEARERGVHEAQADKQGISSKVERLDGKRLGGFGRHGGSSREYLGVRHVRVRPPRRKERGVLA